MTPQKFRNLIWRHYLAQGRHSLPWRKTRDPYAVWVSEMMLQQTQVDRVVPYFNAWMKKYPTVHALAEAPLSAVLTSWQGLGYNRRAKLLHEAAKQVVREHGGTMPKSIETLEALPGIGPYTARAIAAFAYNQDVVFVETNLRTAVIHHFFADTNGIADSEVAAVLKRVLPKHKEGTSQAREWYAALMDYGAHLKRTGVRVNTKSKGYAKQPAFKGSGREVRGAVLRKLARGAATHASILKLFPKGRQEQLEEHIVRLLSEGMIQKHRSTYRLPA